MTRNWKIPASWTRAGTSKQRQQAQGGSQRRESASSVQSSSFNASLDTPFPNSPVATSAKPDSSSKWQSRLRFFKSWQFLVGFMVLTSGTTGFVATAALLKLSSVPNCPQIFLPTASASMRLYCAELAANKGTVEDLLAAIALVDGLPSDHPLHAQISQAVEGWSREILRLTEEIFQEGDLERAIATVQKIPSHVEAYSLVEERIANWREIWSNAEAIATEVEEHLWESRWNEAFRSALKLTQIDNRYWSTTKFQEVSRNIEVAREESRQLSSAHAAVQRGGVDELLKAVEQAQGVSRNSFSYKEAQKIIEQASDKLLAIVKQRFDRNDWQGVLEIANKIPATIPLHSRIQDLSNLARAGNNAQQGSIASLESAVLEAQKVKSDSSFYNRAQTLIARWQLEIEDLSHLTKARDFARQGGTQNLSAAVAQARLIPARNPRHSEAQEEISKWTRQIQIEQDQPILDRANRIASQGSVAALQQGIEEANRIPANRALSSQAEQRIREWQRQIQVQQDRPVLDRANQLASAGSINSLRAGIQEANRIPNNRALSSEAQEKVQTWTRQVQTLEDQPILDRAVALANVGNFSTAISTAQQIRSGRALHSQAQNNIRRWQAEIQANQNLQRANQIAMSQTPDALAGAIRTARQIPSSTAVHRQSVQDVNRWSYQLLSIADAQASFDLNEAIRIAEMIPSGTAASDIARQRTQAWRQMLLPPAPPPAPEFLPMPIETF